MSQSDALDPSNRLASLDVRSGDPAIDSRLNIPQMLTLVDSVLPFEACLYYQVIPLSIEASLLNLGMVDPNDTTAADYVRRQVSYINCSVVSWPVTSDWHRQMLSRYLSYAAKVKQQSMQGQQPTKPVPLSGFQSAEQATFIVDSPETILMADDLDLRTATEQAPEARANVKEPGHTTDQMAMAAAENPVAPPLEIAPLDWEADDDDANPQRISPKALMQKLLKQVIAEGIGRLYFERRPSQGRVLWSKDGVVQSALEDLNLETFQSVINEFKRLTHMPLLPATQTQQTDIERLFKGERVLLRFRLIAGIHGEEATLQVLRGAALRFYQQQQINRLGRDALTIAQSLQKQITEIRHRSQQTLASEPVSAANIVALEDLLALIKTMETQIEQITQNRAEP